ncbi:MAG: hypothetical protein ACLP5E_24730 [Streptosporangiaceae bacterium]
MRAPAQLRACMLEGMPASPGRETGVAHVLIDPPTPTGWHPARSW